jgi:hypothetical protein
MCSQGCPTPGVHATWGECVRAKAAYVAPPGRASRRANDGELAAYASARRQGIQPAGTQMHQVRQAVREADRTGIGDPWRIPR